MSRAVAESPFQLILLPGLGGDQRQFEPQRTAFPDLLVPPWIVPRKKETLVDYAARLAQTIAPTRPHVLGGSSFGGMVAYEMARHLRPQAVVLIGSCRSPRELRPWLRRLRPLVPWAPAQVFALAQWIAPLGVRTFSRCTPEQQQLCAAMFREMDCGFMKWVCRAILGWAPSGPPPVPVWQIHGQQDRVMPWRLAAADELIADGGHLINLTHAQQVNAFIMKAAVKAAAAAP
jgi:pimeloyl-ACP methyl ester carboxylesterase